MNRPLSSAVPKFATRVLLAAEVAAIHRIAGVRSYRGELGPVVVNRP